MNSDNDPKEAILRGPIDGAGVSPMSPESNSKPIDTSAVSRQENWEIIGAVMGRGTCVAGESPRNPRGEALVLVPPGVRIAAATGSEQQASTQGWRVALWPSDEEGNLHIDVGRPMWVSEVSLAYVIGLIELECPRHLSWVADRIERQLLNAQIAQTPDELGVVFSFAEDWKQNAESLLEELDAALAPSGKADPKPHAMDLERLIPDFDSSSPQDPGKYEPRLSSGWMRRFYCDRAPSNRLP